MTKQTPVRRVVRQQELTTRELWLAGLGAVSLTRKQALAGVEQVAFLAQQLRERTVAAIEQGTSAMENGVDRAREIAENYSVRAQSQFDQALGHSAKWVKQAKSEARGRAERVRIGIEQRLQPVFNKLGLAPTAPKCRAPAREKVSSAARKPRARAATGQRPAKAA